MAIILDGKACAESIKADLRRQYKNRKEKPKLAVILIGDDPASQVYVRNKMKDCQDCGFDCEDYRFDADASEQEVLKLIYKLNKDDSINGILVQLPLPDYFDEVRVLESIDHDKDVDYFTPENVGYAALGLTLFAPCTPTGIKRILDYYDIPIDGKHCVVVGRSNIVGKPMANLMLQCNATVTVCHSHTQDLSSFTKQADILIVAVGKSGFITADMVKPGAVVIDVGMNRDENGKLCGDVCFKEVKEVAGAITPVPGGVGPMTRAALMLNLSHFFDVQNFTIKFDYKGWLSSDNAD